MVTKPSLKKEYYQALINRDSQYQGVFYAGIITTGIFCLSTCRARKPKEENVYYFDTIKEALQQGYRPCKICCPTSTNDTMPPDIQKALDLLKTQPNLKINDQTMREEGLSPSKIRRWFKSNYGMTFQSYQRMIRLNEGYELLKKGKNVTQSAFATGYNSLSGFGYTFKQTFGSPPEDAGTLNILQLHRFDTPLGAMYACTSADGLTLLEFTDRRMLETEFEDLSKRLKAKIVVAENELHKKVAKQLNEYFSHNRKEFDLPLDMPGTDFQKEVWNQLLKIPFGETRSYKKQSEAIGKPEAIRAVASANGQNRIAIIVPCHRIIGSDGSLTGYAGGLPRKKWLLEHESGTKQTSFNF
jgi:AraC family transcriptional regulator of adaptative response/methylated-DNA-[protein]-cysteine methyltransferase